METIVSVREGRLEGCRSADEKSIIFKGVPYAEPPVGALRWKRPQPKAPWEPCDYALEAAVSGYWANFARCGNPNGDGLPHWRPYTAEAPVQMRLAETIGEENAVSVKG